MNILRQIWAPLSQYDVSAYSAAACFYISLSILPATALLLTLFSSTRLSSSEWTGFILDIIPANLVPVGEYILNLARPKNFTAILSASVLITLWSASKGILSITEGLQVVLECRIRRNFIVRRIYAILTFLFLAAVIPIILIVHLLGDWIVLILQEVSPPVAALFLRIFQFRYVYTTMLLAGILSLVYWSLPQKPLRFSVCLRGGLFAALGCHGLNAVFSLYIRYFNNYQQLYGSIGLLLLAALWLYFSIQLLLYSCLLTKILQDRSYHPVKIMKEALRRIN